MCADEEDFFDALDNNVDQQFEVALPPNAKEKKHRYLISLLAMVPFLMVQLFL